MGLGLVAWAAILASHMAAEQVTIAVTSNNEPRISKTLHDSTLSTNGMMMRVQHDNFTMALLASRVVGANSGMFSCVTRLPQGRFDSRVTGLDACYNSKPPFGQYHKRSSVS